MDMIISINNNNNNNNNTRLIGNNKNSMERQDIYTNDNNPTASSCTTENGGGGSESPNSSAVFSDFGISKINTVATSSSSSLSLSSPKKSGGGRRSVQKRVVSIPIKEVEGSSRLKGESCHVSTPPSDSWAWRKYGQKPIKGSPYPRGYYRCSSSKGCPARKQVERSRVDPTMLLVTYSAEHNHPWPVSSRSNHNNNAAHKHHQSPPAASSPPEKPVKEDEEIPDQEEADQPGPAEPDPDAAEERFPLVGGDDQFGWFGDHMDTATLESPILADGGGGGPCESLAAVFPMGEEDESLFADLGELPECSLVFRHRGVGPQVEIF